MCAIDPRSKAPARRWWLSSRVLEPPAANRTRKSCTHARKRHGRGDRHVRAQDAARRRPQGGGREVRARRRGLRPAARRARRRGLHRVDGGGRPAGRRALRLGRAGHERRAPPDGRAGARRSRRDAPRPAHHLPDRGRGGEAQRPPALPAALCAAAPFLGKKKTRVVISRRASENVDARCNFGPRANEARAVDGRAPAAIQPRRIRRARPGRRGKARRDTFSP